MSLHIVQIGNAGVPWCSEVHWCRSLEALGHRVTFVQEGPRCERQVRKVLNREGCDLVLYTRTDGLKWDHGDACDLWDEIRSRGGVSASVHLDAFWGLARRDVKVNLGNALFAVDLAATADGDHDAEWEAAGINHLFLPPGVVEQGAHIGTPSREFRGEVGWCGSSKGYHAEWPRRQDLTAALRQRYGRRMIWAGDGNTVREERLNSLYATAHVVAGDSLAPLREKSKYASDRVTESAGRGAILVHPLMDWWADFLGDAVIWSPWEVEGQLDKMDEVLSWSPEKRQAFRERAVEIVRGGHLYTHRMRMLLSALGL